MAAPMIKNPYVNVCHECVHDHHWSAVGGWEGPAEMCVWCGKSVWSGMKVHMDHLFALTARKQLDDALKEVEELRKSRADNALEGLTVARFVQAAASVIDLAVFQQGKGGEPLVAQGTIQHAYDASLDATGVQVVSDLLAVEKEQSYTLEQIKEWCLCYDRYTGSYPDERWPGKELFSWFQDRIAGVWLDPSGANNAPDEDIWSRDY